MDTENKAVLLEEDEVEQVTGGTMSEAQLIFIATYGRCPVCSHPDIKRIGGHYQCTACHRIFLL